MVGMEYHAINTENFSLKVLPPAEILDMSEDNEGRLIVTGTDHKTYFLIAKIDMIED